MLGAHEASRHTCSVVHSDCEFDLTVAELGCYNVGCQALHLKPERLRCRPQAQAQSSYVRVNDREIPISAM